jgi:hypothetical protein
MRAVRATILSAALWACSAPPDTPYQGSGTGDPNGSGSVESGSVTSGSTETGTETSGTASQSSGSSTTGNASTGQLSSGATDSTGSSRTGSVASGGTDPTSGSSVSGTPGSSTGATSGSSSGSIRDAGAAHRNAPPVELTGCAAQVPTAIFGASCEATDCHNSRDHNYDLDLQSPGVAARLVNQPSLEIAGLFLIDPNNWMQSYILLKVELAQPPAGTQMPQTGTKLNASQISCLQQYVEAEAAGPY